MLVAGDPSLIRLSIERMWKGIPWHVFHVIKLNWAFFASCITKGQFCQCLMQQSKVDQNRFFFFFESLKLCFWTSKKVLSYNGGSDIGHRVKLIIFLSFLVIFSRFFLKRPWFQKEICYSYDTHLVVYTQFENLLDDDTARLGYDLKETQFFWVWKWWWRWSNL